jgi:hypothetical protein
MSDTPRTDAEFSQYPSHLNPNIPNFARTLERELNAATQSAKDLAVNFRESERKRIEVELERDQLKAEVEKAQLLVAKMHAAAMGKVCGCKVGVVEDMAELRKECDQWREMARELVDAYPYGGCKEQVAAFEKFTAMEKGNI